MTRTQAIILLLLTGIAVFWYLARRPSRQQQRALPSSAFTIPPADREIFQIRGFDFYVRLDPKRSEQILAAVEAAVGGQGAVFPRPGWAVVLWNDFYAPEAILKSLSQAVQTEVIWLSFQKQVDAFEFQRWTNGQLQRRLTFGCYEKERTWEKVEGQAESWEGAALFDPRDLEREIGFLKDHPPEGKSAVDAEAELRAIWRERRLVVDSDRPNITGRDAAEAVAVAYALPGWE